MGWGGGAVCIRHVATIKSVLCWGLCSQEMLRTIPAFQQAAAKERHIFWVLFEVFQGRLSKAIASCHVSLWFLGCAKKEKRKKKPHNFVLLIRVIDNLSAWRSPVTICTFESLRYSSSCLFSGCCPGKCCGLTPSFWLSMRMCAWLEEDPGCNFQDICLGINDAHQDGCCCCRRRQRQRWNHHPTK